MGKEGKQYYYDSSQRIPIPRGSVLERVRKRELLADRIDSISIWGTIISAAGGIIAPIVIGVTGGEMQDALLAASSGLAATSVSIFGGSILSEKIGDPHLSYDKEEQLEREIKKLFHFGENGEDDDLGKGAVPPSKPPQTPPTGEALAPVKPKSPVGELPEAKKEEVLV